MNLSKTDLESRIKALEEHVHGEIQPPDELSYSDNLTSPTTILKSSDFAPLPDRKDSDSTGLTGEIIVDEMGDALGKTGQTGIRWDGPGVYDLRFNLLVEYFPEPTLADDMILDIRPGLIAESHPPAAIALGNLFQVNPSPETMKQFVTGGRIQHLWQSARPDLDEPDYFKLRMAKNNDVDAVVKGTFSVVKLGEPDAYEEHDVITYKQMS